MGPDGDLVLHKGAEDLSGQVPRLERDAEVVCRLVGAQTVAQSPHKILPPAPVHVVLKVKVERVQS